MLALGLVSRSLPRNGAAPWVEGRWAAAALLFVGKQGLGGAAGKVGAGLGACSLGQHQQVSMGRRMQGTSNSSER